MLIQTLWVNMLSKQVWNNLTFIAAFFVYCYPRKGIKGPGGQGLLHSHQLLRHCSSLTARDWNQMWHTFQMSNFSSFITAQPPPPPTYPKGSEHHHLPSADTSHIYNRAILGLIKQMLAPIPFVNTERQSLATFSSLLGLIRWWRPNP